MANVQAAIAEIQCIGGADRNQKQTSQYKELISGLIATTQVEGLKTVLEHLLTDDTPQLISRGVVSFFAEEIEKLKGSEAYREVAEHALAKLHGQVVSFDDADSTIRRSLFDKLRNEGYYKEAATVLSAMNLEASSRPVTAEEKAEIYVTIAETFLADDETVDAETFVNRASSLMEDVKDVVLQLRYRTTYARVLDANRKFLEAALRYYDLSQTQKKEVSQEDLMELLGKSVTCAILGKAGPQRSRILGTLFKDERINSLETLSSGYDAHAKVLNKMYMEQIIKKPELSAFEASLMPHQKVVLGDGFTILEKAVIEHNMVAASRVYDNIRFKELGNLLEIDPARAEKVAARMIGEGRLKGSMDQIDGVLQFEGDADVLQSWDDKITNVCMCVNGVLENIGKQYPGISID